MKNQNLLALLIFLVLVIIGLVAGLVWVNTNKTSQTYQDSLIDTSEKMAGYNGPVSDSTRALVLTETIQDKLSSNPDYNPPQAVEEYQKVFNEATGDLKLYVAIEYANYVYQTFNDLNRAVAILNEVANLINISNEEDYYGALYNIYATEGDTEQANYYQQIISEKAEAKATQKEPSS